MKMTTVTKMVAGGTLRTDSLLGGCKVESLLEVASIPADVLATIQTNLFSWSTTSFPLSQIPVQRLVHDKFFKHCWQTVSLL